MCGVPKLFHIWFGPGPVSRDMKLNRKKVHWIIRQKQKRVGTKEIAQDMKITRRRVQQLWKILPGNRPHASSRPEPRASEEPHVKREAEIVREAYGRYRFGARMLEMVIRKQYRVRISNNRIHSYLMAEGLAREEPGKEESEQVEQVLPQAQPFSRTYRLVRSGRDRHQGLYYS